MDIRIVSLQGNAEESGDALVIETIRGQICVLEEHADMVATVEPGVLTVSQSGNVRASFYAGAGIMRVEGGDCVVMLDRLVRDSEQSRAESNERVEELASKGEDALDEAERNELDFLRRFLAQ